MSFSRDKRECNRNNGISRLASTCNPTRADLQMQGICQLSLQHRRECHNTLSGNKEWWCNRCNCDSAERDAVRACRPEIRSPRLPHGCAGDATLYCTEALPDGSAVASKDATILRSSTELAELSIPFARGPEQAEDCCDWRYLKESAW